MYLSGYVAKQLSGHACLLFGERLGAWLAVPLPPNTLLEPSFDLLALLLILLALILVLGSTRVAGTVSLILATVCTLIVSSSILVGFFYADPANWLRPGFFAHGYLGVLKGASHISYAYIGVEALSYMAEELKYPDKRVPAIAPLLNTLLSLYFFLLALSAGLAFDTAKYPDTIILPQIFGQISVPASRYVLSVGGVCGLSGCLVAILIPASRLLVAIVEKSLAVDGLLPSRLGDLSRGSPVSAVLVSTALVVATLPLNRRFAFGSLILILNLVGIVALPSLSLALRLMTLIALTVHQRYAASPIGLGPPVSRYRNLAPRKRSLSSVLERNGSVAASLSSANTRREDTDSVTSSFICRNIAILQMGSQSFVPREPDENSRLVEEKSCGVVKSVSRYNSVACERPLIIPNKAALEVARKGSDSESFHTVSLGASIILADQPPFSQTQPPLDPTHNCLRSPCSPGEMKSVPFYHLYDRAAPEVPYYSRSSGYARSKATEDPKQIEERVRRLVCSFATVALGLGLCLSLLEPWITAAHPAAICAVTGLISLLIVLSVLLGSQAVNDESPTRHRAPVFPYLSLFGLALLGIFAGTSTWQAFSALGISILAGLCVYACWGLGHGRGGRELADSATSPTLEESRRIIPPDNSSTNTHCP